MKSEARLVMASLLTGIAGGIGLTVAYAMRMSTQLQGVLLAASLAGIGVALVAWSRGLGEPDASEDRHPLRSEPTQPVPVPSEPSGEPSRRSFLFGFGAAIVALGVGLAAPIRSLGRDPERALRTTAWRAGLRVVDPDGNPVMAGQITERSVTTVFPDGHTGDANAQALLVKVDPAAYRPRPGREGWAPDGLLVLSKVCTHAGCPVGLYEADRQQLLCPCHQSTFDVLDGARPVFGPAPRPLPQLPISIDSDGFLVADGDFPEPIGPGFWDRGR